MVLLKLRSECSRRGRRLPHHGWPWRGRASWEIPTKRMLIGLLMLLLKLLGIAVHVVYAETNVIEANDWKGNVVCRRREEIEKKCREEDWIKSWRPLNPKQFICNLVLLNDLSWCVRVLSFRPPEGRGPIYFWFFRFFFFLIRFYSILLHFGSPINIM